jgi:hypothetical protein
MIKVLAAICVRLAVAVDVKEFAYLTIASRGVLL